MIFLIVLALLSPQLVIQFSLAHKRRQYRAPSTTSRYVDHDFDSSEEKGNMPSNPTGSKETPPKLPQGKTIEKECQRYLEQAADSHYAPTCGTDGKTYSNKLQLAYQNCLDEFKGFPKVTVKYAGECSNTEDRNSCSSLIDQVVPVYDPVCGSDQNTYTSVDDLNFQNCLNKESGKPADITVAYNGECGEQTTKKVKKDCSILIDQIKPVLEPVCGSDHNTWTNVGYLNLQNCLNTGSGGPSDVTVLHLGECEGQTTEKNKIDCNAFLIKAKQSNFDPVCGSDGKTYDNVEQIAYENCLLQQKGVEQFIDVKNSGPCYNPSSPRTPDNRPDCLSLIDRTKLNNHKPVCGSDGQTYINKDFVMLANCINQISGAQPVTVVNDGECYSNCPTTYNIPTDYVCGSDDETYNNIQALERRNCLKKLKGRDKIKAIHKGFCFKLPYKGIIWV